MKASTKNKKKSIQSVCYPFRASNEEAKELLSIPKEKRDGWSINHIINACVLRAFPDWKRENLK